MPSAFLKPRNGLVVPNPRTGRPLPKEGQKVVMDAYWHRRMRDEEVEDASLPVEQEPAEDESKEDEQ